MPVAFNAVTDNISSGTRLSGTITLVTVSHTASGNQPCVLVWVSFGIFALSASAFTLSATYGGQAMTQVAVIGANNMANNNQLYAGLALFALLDPPTGSQTVTVSATRPTGGSYSATAYAAAVSYTGVGGWGTPVVDYGSGGGTSLSLVVPSATNNRVAQAFHTVIGNPSVPGSYNQTARGSFAGGTGTTFSAIIGDAPGAPSVTFTATRQNNAAYCEIGLDLIQGSVDHEAGASLGVIATTAAGLSRGTSIAGSLTATANHAGLANRRTNIAASLAASSSPSGVGRYDAMAAGHLFVDGTLAGSLLKTLNAAATLSVTSGYTAAASEGNTIAASLTGVATMLAGANTSRRIAASLTGTATPSGGLTRGRHIGGSLTGIANSYGVPSNNRPIQGHLMAYGAPTGIQHRTTAANTNLEIVAAPTVAATSGPIIAGDLSVTAAMTAAVHHNIAAITSLSVQCLPDAAAGVAYASAADLAVEATIWAATTDVREIVVVEPDARDALVEAEVRVAGAGRDDRVFALASAPRVVDAGGDVRVETVESERRVAAVEADDRAAFVEDENFTAEV